MAEVCDLCRASALEPAYWPVRSGRDTVVHLCTRCGLLQSLPRGGTAASSAPYARRGSGFRAHACMKLLRAHTDLNGELSVLDVGARRGAFARMLTNAAPRAHVLMLEPDPVLAEAARDIPRAEHVQSCIENTAFAAESFDIIHSCKTIERLDSPASVLADHWRTLKPGGLLIVDAPNLTHIGSADIVDEWFDDKHRYHFSPVTLGRALDAAGFDIIDGPDPMDRETLTFAAVKRMVAHRPVPRDLGEVARAAALIAAYSGARARNLVALTAVAAELRRMAPRKVAMWGAGRLFDSLVTHGGFDPKSLSLLVDSIARADERHGIPLNAPEALEASPAGVVVVMSRTFAREIARLAKARAPKAEIVLYGDLLARARMALAA